MQIDSWGIRFEKRKKSLTRRVGEVGEMCSVPFVFVYV